MQRTLREKLSTLSDVCQNVELFATRERRLSPSHHLPFPSACVTEADSPTSAFGRLLRSVLHRLCTQRPHPPFSRSPRKRSSTASAAPSPNMTTHGPHHPTPVALPCDTVQPRRDNLGSSGRRWAAASPNHGPPDSNSSDVPSTPASSHQGDAAVCLLVASYSISAVQNTYQRLQSHFVILHTSGGLEILRTQRESFFEFSVCELPSFGLFAASSTQ